MPYKVGIILIALVAAGCAGNVSKRIKIGQTREQVIAAVGEPDDITEFTIPDEPYFGPQEGLVNILEPGTEVEEWRFADEEEVTYVWFASKSSEPRERWVVVDTATFPADAVY